MITFQNKGLVDLDAVRTFGVSAKENVNPIGYFGTGLKYAIAIVLRNGGEIKIWRGKTAYKFGVRSKTIRGEKFKIVTMQDKDLGFTTHMGINWEPWQAFRELYCNTLDEGGETIDEEIKPKAGHTTIQVTGFPAFEQAYVERDRIVLTEQPNYTLDGVEVLSRPSGVAYYRGVRVGNLQSPSRFTYNVKDKMDLTEDRTMKYEFLFRSRVANAIVTSTDAKFLREVLTAPRESLEHELPFTCSSTPSSMFLDTVQELLRDPTIKVVPSAIESLREHRDIADTLVDSELDRVDQEMLDESKMQAKRIGFPVEAFPIRVVETLGPGLLGKASNGTIYIAKTTFVQGQRRVLGTLIEEFIHLQHGLYDETYEMQNYLVDKLAELASRAG